MKKLKGGGNYYRIRVGEYRIRIILEADTRSNAATFLPAIVTRPNDFIFGDLDGVIVIPEHLTLEVLLEADRRL